MAGAPTRDHGDLDAAVPHPDQLAIQARLDGWDLRAEVVLLYKSKRPGAADEHDARVAIPRLSGPARAWLAAAIATDAPDHHWLPLLA